MQNRNAVNVAKAHQARQRRMEFMIENRGLRQTAEASALQSRPLKDIPGTRTWFKALKEKER